jgi:amino acid adenylation domain-containing protein
MNVSNSGIAEMHPDEKRALLAQLLKRKAGHLSSFHPLSQGQRSLWFLQQLSPESAAYNIMHAFRICSPLDVDALKQAFQILVERHTILRTTYLVQDDKPVQEIHPHMDVSFQVIDASLWSSAELYEKLAQEAHRPFDLEQDALMRVCLFSDSGFGNILLLTLHHIAIDAQCLAVLLEELGIIYSAILAGRPVPLPAPNIQYTDFVKWQKKMLAGPEGDRQRQYWQRQLGGELPVLDLPSAKPRPTSQTYRGAMFPFEINEQVTHHLKLLARSEGATLYMTLLAALQVLLFRYTRQEDIIIGGSTSGRSRAEFEGVLGYFTNMLALRANLQGNPTFKEYLGRVRQILLSALEHQDYPFPLLVERLQVARDPSRSPVFQIVFTLQGYRRLVLEKNPSKQEEGEAAVVFNLSDLVLEIFPLDQRFARFDLELEMIEAEGSLSGYWQYNTDLFERNAIQRLVEHFQTLLESIIANPEQTISGVSILPEAERDQMSAWNETETDYGRHLNLAQLFEAQVARTPHKIAAVCGEETLSFEELNCKANQLAHYLQSLGVGPDVLVGLYMGRGLDALIGLVGIIKAGGAYLPLDLDYPEERLAFMLADAQAPVVLTQKSLVERLPLLPAKTVCLDSDWPTISQFSSESPVCYATPDNLAYVIYTSGSTGTPKGVSIPQHAITRLLFHTNYISLQPTDKIAQASNISFDAATFEIWGALLCGAQLVFFTKEIVLSPIDFAAQLRKQKITTLFLTTALFNLIASQIPDAFATLRDLLFGGEAVDPRWVREVLKKGAPERLLHVYGPTETTTFATWQDVQRVPEGITTVPIGKALSNTTLYVLDDRLQPTPIGIPGELYIGGDGLARGYLNRPEITAQKFIPNPFSKQPGARLYKTGDLVRYLPEGEVEFVGRVDHQVKLRGFRIELGEIEAVLSRHPDVQESVVLIQETQPDPDSPKISHLVAYLVPHFQTLTKEEESCEPGEAEHVTNWQKLYDDLYAQPAPNDDPAFNIVGWNSSYTSEPIPPEEMQEQVHQTVDRILSLQPKRILEIGCGTGMLLFRIAPRCQEYWGTDFSKAAIDYIQEQLKKTEYQGLPVRLQQKIADDFTDIPPHTFDVVVLNSIVQYFPNAAYLQRVIEGAVNAVVPGGHIFIGDVRNFAHIKTYHTSILLHQAAPSLPLQQLEERVHRNIQLEEELLLDPGFFRTLPQSIPAINQVQVLLKRGRTLNELTKFRYDALLKIGSHNQTEDHSGLDWQRQDLTPGRVRQILRETSPEILAITGVPNARLEGDIKAVECLERKDSLKTAGDVVREISRTRWKGIDPEELWAISADLPYEVEIGWFGDGPSDCFDILFRNRSALQQGALYKSEAVFKAKPLANYANNPLHGKMARRLVPKLREFLQKHLPDYMMPAAFIFLDALPLTPNGKIDRRALPAAEWRRADLEQSFVSPKTPVEEKLARIWAEVLGLTQVGIYDNFFELGGHSLLATQIASRVRDTFGVKVPLQCLFESPTIHTLAQTIEASLAVESSTASQPILSRVGYEEEEL